MTRIICGNPSIVEKNGEIFLENQSTNEILNRFDTPIILYLLDRIKQNCATFRQACCEFFPNFRIFYSVKANYLGEIVKIIHDQGIGMEIVSLSELNILKSRAISGAKCIAGGPYNSTQFLNSVIEYDIPTIIAYTLEDLNRIEEIAQKREIARQKIWLRIRKPGEIQRFGIPINSENISKIKSKFQSSKILQLAGILSHVGTQLNDLKKIEKNSKFLLESARTFTKELGLANISLNFGGGFPEASVLKKDKLKQIFSIIARQIQISSLPVDQIIFEPGRYIVGDSGVILSKVHFFDTESRWAYIDVGNHICPRFSKSAFHYYNLSKINESQGTRTSIAGILPTEQDVFAKGYYFTKQVDKGDIVLITNTGAYTLSFSYRFPYPYPVSLILSRDKKTRIQVEDSLKTAFF